MEKINIAELLKDCPKGMELDCTMYDNCTYAGIEDVGYIDILINTPSGRIRLTKEGCYIRHDDNAKCVIFPKGKTTWEGFAPPCQFKDGDIVVTTLGNIAIIRKPIGEELFYIYGLMVGNGFYKDETVKVVVERPATEEEKQKLFDAIKANGYKWNPETKTLEKLINKNKFVVGTTITNGKIISKIVSRDIDSYQLENGNYVFFNEVHNWELVPDKFDISTLKPFDKVLYRMRNNDTWCAGFFNFYKNNNCFVIGNAIAHQCIPYEENKHLLGTTNDCDDFYKTWEK